MSDRPCLAVMARAPIPRDPAVKSRLSDAVPDAAARVALYAAFLADTLATCRRVRGVHLRVACTPPGADAAFAPLGVAPDELLPQRGRDLGTRERNLFADLLTAGFDPIVVIGSDLPTLPAAHLEAAFAALQGAGRMDGMERTDRAGGAGQGKGEVVLGPSEDGGYYLIGLRAPAPGTAPPDLFTGIRWSTPHAFDDTVAAARRAGLTVRRLPAWYDVDDEEGLERLQPDLDADPQAAPATRAVLRALGLLGPAEAGPHD